MTGPSRFEPARIGQAPAEKARNPAYPSRWLGFSSLDSLFSILPIVLMVMLAISMASFLSKDVAERTQRQMLFDKLAMTADFSIKSGLVVRIGDVRYPNWIDPGLLDQNFTSGLKEKAGLRQLSLSLGEEDGYEDGVDERVGSEVAGSDLAGSGIGVISEDTGSEWSETVSTPGICIYRLVVVGRSKTIKRLIVCGS